MREALRKGSVGVGDVLKGRYRILSLIGKGGMSRVYLAADLELTNKQWAVKEIDRRASDSAGRPIEQSLAREAELLSRLDHPNIVNIVDIEKTEDFIYVVMDHVEGIDLETRVREQGPQPEEDVRRWMLQVSDALDYLHRQSPPIVFCDLKPANIMLHPDGYIKLIDFGAARELVDGPERDRVLFGTREYAAPEMDSVDHIDPRSDIFTMGATMWHLLAGKAPSKERPIPDVRTVNPGASEGFAGVIIPKCCAMGAEDRYQTCEELDIDLERYEQLTSSFRERQVRRVRTFGLAAAAAIMFMVIGIACTVVRSVQVTERFEYQMQLGVDQRQTDPEAAAEAYVAAIGYRPDAVEAYLGLIETYKVDGEFDVGERDQFNSVYQQNLTALQRSRDFSELSFEIGKLYWYFYSYGAGQDSDDNQTTRIRASMEYFRTPAEDATFEDQDRAQVYYGIAQFTTDIATAVRTDDDDEEMYAAYWDNLVGLVRNVGSDTNETVQLDSYALLVNAMETYAVKFEGAGVEKAEMEELYRLVEQGLDRLRAQIGTVGSDEDDAAMLARIDELESRLQNQVNARIAAAYSNAVVGQH